MSRQLLYCIGKRELAKVSALLIHNYAEAVAAGNIQYAAYSLSVGLVYSFDAGTPIPDLLQKIAGYEKVLVQLKNNSSIARLRYLREGIAKLSDPNSMQLSKSKPIDSSGWAGFYVRQLMEGWIFRDFGMAMEAIKAFPQYEKGLSGSYSIALFYFYKTLTLLALVGSAPFIKCFGLRLSIKQGIARIKSNAKRCPSNHHHKYLLLLAEWARVNDKFTEAECLYEEAIECAAKEKFIHEAAIASELFGRFYLEKKRVLHALLFFREALFYYEKWGAQNKVEQLKEEFEELLQEKEGEAAEGEQGLTVSIKTKSIKTRVEDTTLKIGAGALEISTIQKSIEVINSTILMDDLLKNLMSLAMEHAGAERGLLLMAKRKEFFHRSRGRQEKGRDEAASLCPRYTRYPSGHCFTNSDSKPRTSLAERGLSREVL